MQESRCVMEEETVTYQWTFDVPIYSCSMFHINRACEKGQHSAIPYASLKKKTYPRINISVSRRNQEME